MANTDGKISEEELKVLNEFVGGLSSKKYPEHIRKQIDEIRSNPLTLNEALKYLNRVEIDNFKSFNSYNGSTKTLEEYYILGYYNENYSMEVIKKKYKKLFVEYHPDKIQSKGLPDSFVKFATEQMQKINSAYETIKKLNINLQK